MNVTAKLLALRKRVRKLLQNTPFLMRLLALRKRVRKLLQNTPFLMRQILRASGFISDLLGDRRGVLLYLGAHDGYSFSKLYRHYRICYAFEANPELAKQLADRFKGFPNVRIIACAVAEHDGETLLNISDNQGRSSSLGQISASAGYGLSKSIVVPCINLHNFVRRRKIGFIDTYISDLQGMDLAVLRTLKPLIQSQAIGEIQAEVTHSSLGNLYFGIPDNSERGFGELLSAQYRLVARGPAEGLIEAGHISDFPGGETDCLWMPKD